MAYNPAMLSDNQIRILRENKRICEQYKFHYNRTEGLIDRDTMCDRISYDLQLPKTTIASRIQQMRNGGVKFPMLKRKQRASVVMPTEELNSIFAEPASITASTTASSNEDQPNDLPTVKV